MLATVFNLAGIFCWSCLWCYDTVCVSNRESLCHTRCVSSAAVYACFLFGRMQLRPCWCTCHIYRLWDAATRRTLQMQRQSAWTNLQWMSSFVLESASLKSWWLWRFELDLVLFHVCILWNYIEYEHLNVWLHTQKMNMHKKCLNA
jgi:hypothetical protein